MVSLVTGGASGLGRGTVERFIKQGSKVVLCDLPSSDGDKVAKELGSDCLFVPTDITKEEDVSKALEETRSKFRNLDVVVNCAGIGIAKRTFNFKFNNPHELDEFRRVLEVNTCGTFNVIRLAVPLMLEKDKDPDGHRGVFINTASVAAFDGQIGQVAYSASKGALVSMTLPMARDLCQEGIRVVTLAPGVFDTPLLQGLPPKSLQFLCKTVPFPTRLGSTDEFAHMAQCIVENPYINGEVIRIDGALRMMM